MKRIGIRQQVALLTLIPSLIMVACMEAWFLHDRFSDMDDDLLESGKLIASQLASSSEYGVFSNNQQFLQDISRGVLQQPDVRGLVVLNAASEVLVKAGDFSGHVGERADEAAFEKIVEPAPLQSHSGSRKQASLQTPVLMDERSLWIYHPIIPEQVALDDDAVGPPQQLGAVIVELDRQRSGGEKSRMLWGTIFATAFFLLLFIYVVARASRSITQPVRLLSQAVHAIGEGDLGKRVALSTRIKELDTLVHGLNRMAAELQEERGILEQRIEDATLALRLKKEEAERASHDKSRFLATASHDLRQPLHALGLYVGELHRKVSTIEQRDLVRQIDHSIESLTTLLNALLDISKLDAGAIVPQLHPCDMRDMLERIEADFHMVAVIKDLRLIVRPCARFAVSDPVLLERILTNLVSNAIRYTPPNGCVMVACRRRGNALRIEVRDNGIGISKENQADIFREFFQLNQNRHDALKGLGLGLSIVDRLVKLLGHRFDLRSEPGRGSVFAIEVPLVPEAASTEAAAQASQAPVDSGIDASARVLDGKRLLVVDDDEAVLASTAGLLASWGCETSRAASLSEVEGLLQDGRMWDLVVTDYQLGQASTGIDIIMLARQHSGQHVPGILISGDTSADTLALANKHELQLLHKPVKPAKLRSLIMHLLDAAA